MISEIKKLLESYNSWLSEKTNLRELPDNWIEITTPYLDRHNDYIQIYAKVEKKGEIFLTDDGYTIDDLKLSGCELNSPKRKELFQQTLNGFGVKCNNDALIMKTTQNNFAIKKHNLLQTILAVNDLFYLSSPIIASLFMEDIINWFDLNEVRYTPQVKITGHSGYDHLFDFVIPKSRRKPERILQAINKPGKSKAEALIFAWMDTREVRSSDSLSYAILNDQEENPSSDVIDAFKNYDIIPILWSDKEKFRDELVA